MPNRQSKTLQLIATLKEVNYIPLVVKQLATHDINALQAGELSSVASYYLTINNDTYGFSQWVSPKRTRSFPYSRVYDTLSVKNRITLIPFCKDEGLDGDRDFLQWDTISLMSLLNVHVIIGFYISAEKNQRTLQKHKHKITNQKYDYCYVAQQIKELENYQSSALHWNLAQIEKLPNIARTTQTHYINISKKTKVKMHSAERMAQRVEGMMQNADSFKQNSRQLAEQAQNREIETIQPKEKVIGGKASILMKNLLGGHYFLTADEYSIIGRTLFIIEKKHSARKKIPSESDIKDAFIKMSLFSNIDKFENKEKLWESYQAVIGLTSARIEGYLHSNMSDVKIKSFIQKNKLSVKEARTLHLSIKEARQNRFSLFLINAEEPDKQKTILKQLKISSNQ